MAHRAPHDRSLTLAGYQALPDDDGFIDEVSRGRLVREPAPGNAQSRLVTLLAHELMLYVKRHPGCGRVFSAGGFVLCEEPLTVRQPDVAFVREERVPPRHSSELPRGAPDLAIEVLSPSNRPHDVIRKVTELLDAGAHAVWVIDPERELATVYEASSPPRVFVPGESLTADAVLPGFALELAALFADY